MTSVVASADGVPTQQSYAVFRDLSERIDQQLGRLREVVETDVLAFSHLIRESEIPAIVPTAHS